MSIESVRLIHSIQGPDGRESALFKSEDFTITEEGTWIRIARGSKSRRVPVSGVRELAEMHESTTPPRPSSDSPKPQHASKLRR